MRISRYISRAQATASTADSPARGAATWTITLATKTPTTVPPKRATDRSYVRENSGRITMTAAIGTQ